MTFNTIRLILGDQLNARHSWFQDVDQSVLYLIAELHPEATYVRHHVQKVCAFFAAMRAFARELQQDGHQVLHLNLDQTLEFSDVSQLVHHYVKESGAAVFEYQRPDEFRLATLLNEIEIQGCRIQRTESEHFLLPFEQIEQHFPQGKHIMMEHFYRKMRKNFSILMDDGKPKGGKWNYDANNRNKLKTADIKRLPTPLLFGNDVTEIRASLERHNISTIGQLEGPLLWPINRNQSLTLLAHFCSVCLPNFGRFQDAMTQVHESKWSLYHSRLSFALNSKMLHPLEVIDSALSAYESNPDIDISQAEGFIRQILGWREYIRGVYWANMPDYAEHNHFDAKRHLPKYFWSGETKMACMKEAIGQSLDFAYAHHIQRLMVTGNFCLLTEIDPAQVDKWYLGIYVDAIEWVEMPNTRGMALFADGGIVGTKPYAASGAYIDRMSDYCKGCHYNHSEKTQDNACPLNSLYWRFMHKHREMLTQNPRIGVIYRSWDNLEEQAQSEILQKAEHYLEHIETL
ncbi:MULTISPECIES: cryptochrome/photolyase family protein [Vibrio]|uniref:cryptochrome/photolyase family protein n=1 Tax=Vibrio TaxID=662 RepID=UPI002074BB09|nr:MULTISPECIES: cryptochrome/photolyase family protein [Vibrio]USD34953.1 cryptochrome/photolyase family protein [Vibrio sp. SCSIO 43186]USD48018.1 cryptochrome/photolyase family protein [Vibrio sp. SCSIO 43145]USD72077.1 cryptochrome/photolyase family protein [Vibrio sp. SCSIO 43139]USD97748.1 cryptochrome/photolyase family protein [Vibrio coralliilyticus]